MQLQRVLLATDGSQDSRLAARAAADLCKKSGAELHLVHAYRYPQDYGYPGVLSEDYVEACEESARMVAEDEKQAIEKRGCPVAGVHVEAGPAIEVILDVADGLKVDLIFMGSRGRGPIRRLVVGSVSEGVVHHADHPVLVMRGGEEAWPPRWVVIGDDGSEAARHAGELAATIGGHFDARGELVRVFPELPEQDTKGRAFNPRLVEDALRRAERALGERAGELERPLGRRPAIVVATGDPAEKLVRLAAEKEAPLVAVGSRRLGAMQRLRLGSVSTNVLRAAEGPVLVHPARR